MVRYSPRAAKALSYLKRPYNDIDIFVEDTCNHNMWLEMLRNILPPTVKITSVNQMGGRSAVVESCKLDQENDGRRKLYIIDGDFDLLLGRPKPRLKHLYRLRAYCFENLVISQESAVYVGVASRPSKTESDLVDLFDYDNWEDHISNLLMPLFVTYATIFRLADSVQTTGFSVTKLLLETALGPTLCPRKTFARLLNVTRSAVSEVGLATFAKQRREVQKRVASLSLAEAVSGKDYLFPLFMGRLRRLYGFQGSAEQLKVQLARSVTRYTEPYLWRRLHNIAA